MQRDKLEMQEKLDSQHPGQDGREHDLYDREIEQEKLPDDDLVAGDSSFLQEEPEKDPQEEGEGLSNRFRQK